MKRTYSQIDLDERRKIARWYQAGVSVEVIAENSAGIARRSCASFSATPLRIVRCRN